MKVVSQPQGRATMSTGGAAKFVNVPPMETLTNRRPRVAYFSLLPGCRSKNCRARSSAQIVIAAGSVMNDPRIGPIVGSSPTMRPAYRRRRSPTGAGRIPRS